MSTRAQLSETINRLLPGEANKRIRTAILEAANYSGTRTDGLRQSIDLANRVRTGLLISGTTTILTDTSAELSGYVWVVDFAVQQPSGVTSLPIDAPEASFVREDYFLGLADGTIAYRAGTVDALGNSFPPVYDPTDEVVLRIVRRNPDGSNDDIDVPESSTLIDFAEQNIIPYVAGGKLKNSGIQVIFDALGELAGFRFPSQVKGLPAVNDDEFVTKSQLPVITQYGRISGGVIQWASGLTYNFSRAILAITGECIAESGQVTLDPADPTDPRFDGLGWEKIAEGIADRIKLTGIPSSTPAFRQFDPETQVEGIFVLVPAAATEPPGITTENVYLENTEWAVSFAGIGTGNADSTADPKEGTKAIETSAIRNAFKIILDRGSVLDLNTLTDPTIGWDQKLKSQLGNNQNFDIIFLDGSGAPASNLLQVPLSKSNLAYQFVGLNLDAFTFTTKLIRYIEIRYRQNGSGTFLGAFFDNIKIQGGVAQPPQTGGGIPEAPQDSVYYGRRNKAWSPVTEEAPDDGQEYVRKNKAWVVNSGGSPLDPDIVDGLDASLVDSPGTSNKYVTVSLLNSYGYTQEAPINGNHYARKDGAWVAFAPFPEAPNDGGYYARRNLGWTAFTPFTVAGTPTNGHVVTLVSGVPTWQAPSGGGSNWTLVAGNIYRNSFVGIGPFASTAAIFQLHVQRNQAGTDESARAAIMIQQLSSQGAANFFLENNLGKRAGMQLNGSNYLTGLNNKFNFFTVQDDRMEFLTNGGGISGGTAGVDFRLGGYSAPIAFRFEPSTGFFMKNGSRSSTLEFQIVLYGTGVGHGLDNKCSIWVPTGNNAIYNGLVLGSNNQVANGQNDTVEIRAGGFDTSCRVVVWDRNGAYFRKGVFQIDNLPTTDPLIAGRLWRSGNDVKISTG